MVPASRLAQADCSQRETAAVNLRCSRVQCQWKVERLIWLAQMIHSVLSKGPGSAVVHGLSS